MIDDGGHETEQQIVTLEETLPYLQPGGVYICEDIHSEGNPFSLYVSGLIAQLNGWYEPAFTSTGLKSTPSPFQRSIKSIHIYPFLVVIERNDVPLEQLECTKNGSVEP